MGTSLYKRVDDSSQCQQTFVDQSSLSGTLVLGTAPLDVFAASQIYQVELPSADKVLTRIGRPFDVGCDSKDSMTS